MREMTMAAQTTLVTSGAVTTLKSDSSKTDSLLHTALRRIRRDKLTLMAIGLLLILSTLSLLAPVITDVLNLSYTQPDSSRLFLPIGDASHPLGTDHLGRDLLARLLYGGRVSLGIGFAGAISATLIGVTIGLIAGYYQGGRFRFIDDAVMWFVTTLNSLPVLMLLILIASVLTPTIPTLIFVLTMVSWTGTMRLIRGETLSKRENEYVISARAMGAGSARIMFVHILPNTLSVLMTALAIGVGTLILTESALSFLGLGVRPPEPSWGNMLTGAQAHFRQGAHLSILPGLLIALTVLSLFLIGDGLRDAFDPTSKK
jgi:peptide/nickel transport system permease protein